MISYYQDKVFNILFLNVKNKNLAVKRAIKNKKQDIKVTEKAL